MKYLPIFMRIEGKRVLIVGGGAVAARKTETILRSGGYAHIIAPALCPALDRLARDGRIGYEARGFRAVDIRNCALVIAATDDIHLNRRVYTLAEFAGALRARVREGVPNATMRRRFWERFFQGAATERLLAGQEGAAREIVERMIDRDEAMPEGEVYLVGTGPGDPDLLTFRALRLMQQADVVLFDRDMSEEILNLVRRDAEHIDVRGQSDIHALMARLAGDGKRVLRLKRGNAFRHGGEEGDFLAALGIPFQTVPGVTATIPEPSYSPGVAGGVRRHIAIEQRGRYPHQRLSG
jgi:uroporphyrin-III C-methyltransferase/precorrin-2 dehydrogenase/sirohydrochlorin ferrochelatase